jgi:hypothetical protein
MRLDTKTYWLTDRQSQSDFDFWTKDPNEKGSVIADCLEKQFTSHDLCEENHEPRLETTVQILLPPPDATTSQKIRPYAVQKLRRSMDIDIVDLMAFQTNALGIFQEKHYYI